MAIKSVNLLTHYTDYTIAHVHGGALGWLGCIVFAITYYLAPRLWGTKLYSLRLANIHFWCATIGILLYVTSMWAAGITQGLMWFANQPDGLLKYPQFMETVIALKPLYWIRAIGGSIYLGGFVICIFNVYKTAASGKAVTTSVTVVSERAMRPVHETLHERIEGNGLVLGLLAAVVVIIGGIVEFVPTFLIKENVPTISSVKPYTALEVEGRDVYVREGCYNCHSQMVRTYSEETKRYGQASQAGEFVYDRPFQWGSKRTGPDLHRVGGKYPNLWHFKHMNDPRSTTPDSIMPTYAWLSEDTIDFAMLPAKIHGLRRLGVPYTDSDETNSELLARQQSRAIAEELVGQGAPTSEDKEIIALIAYLQRLGTDIKKAAEKSEEK